MYVAMAMLLLLVVRCLFVGWMYGVGIDEILLMMDVCVCFVW
jgi:hypothetical protein